MVTIFYKKTLNKFMIDEMIDQKKCEELKKKLYSVP